MGFSSFRIRVLLRIIMLGGLIFLFFYLLGDQNKIISAIIVGFTIVLSIVELFRYVERTNRKLTRFLESVRYSDFISGFASDHKLGKSFKDLNVAFNEVLEAFRKARSEKEEHWQYLNTVIQHVNTGILSFDLDGRIELINHVAKGLLRRPQIRNITELEEYDKGLYNLLRNIKTGQQSLYRIDNRIQLDLYLF